MYKALISDVDGTFVTNHRESLPTKKLIEAVRKAKKKVKVCLATGRPLFEVEDIIKAADITDISVVCGGAQVVNPVTKKVLWEQGLFPEDKDAVLTIAKKLNLMNCIIQGNGDSDFSGAYQGDNILQVCAVRLLPETAETFTSEVSELPNVVAHSVPSWAPGRIDVMVSHTLATKQHGIFELAKLLGIETHEMIGIGDGGNDFPLLMACGLKIAMGNASDDLKAIADYVAPPVDEDGLAHVIEKFILTS